MKDESDRLLVETFPNLYKDRHGDKRRTCMCWGFECGEGWFDLIWELSAKLESLIVKEGPQEYPMCASQVKEKFGGLRFYMTCATPEIYDIIGEYEHKSYKTCETCGKKGKIRGGVWNRTLCTKCAIEQKYLPKKFIKRQIRYVVIMYNTFKWKAKRKYYSLKYKFDKLIRREK